MADCVNSSCGRQCFIIGGPWIAEDPDCPIHNGTQTEDTRDAELATLRAEVARLATNASGEAAVCAIDELRAEVARLRALLPRADVADPDPSVTGWGDGDQAVRCPHCGEENSNPFWREETIREDDEKDAICEFCDGAFWVRCIQIMSQFRFGMDPIETTEKDVTP